MLNVKPKTMFCSDNLDILRGINSRCIDLIYLDPPFNKKKIFTAPTDSSAAGAEFRDIFREQDIKDEWVQTIEQNNTELHHLLTGIKHFSNSYNYCYCIYMAIRLVECRRVLKDSGSIYLHCDPTMSHYLKILLDCIFGEKGFRNEIIWLYKFGGSSKKQFARKHDIIFYYSKGSRWTFNEKIMREFDTESNWGQREDGKLLTDWWYVPTLNTMAKERTGYPTQKPLALLERIIKASSNEGDIVLDPFCGCATTCIAAERLQRQWIGIDVSHKAYELVKTRLDKEVPADLLRAEPSYSTSPPKRSKDDEADTSYVYIMFNEAYPKYYKVGVGKNPEKRASGILSGAPSETKLLFKYETPHYLEIERFIHEKYPGIKEWVIGEFDSIRNDITKYNPE